MLSECPQCRYSLKGLPAEHRCPECGLGYDAASELFKPAHSRALLWAAVGPVMGGFWMLLQVLNVARALPGKWQWTMWLFSCAYVSMLAWFGWRLWKNYRRGAIVATMPDALWLRFDRATEEHIPWAGISRVVVSRGFVGATMFLKETKTVRDIRGVFKNRADAERFVEQAEVRIANASCD